jgi:hypothetical protein
MILRPSTINSRLGHRIAVISLPFVAGINRIARVFRSNSISLLNLVRSATVALVPMAPTAMSNTPVFIKFSCAHDVSEADDE